MPETMNTTVWLRIPITLLTRVDHAAAVLKTTRSAFMRTALVEAVAADHALPVGQSGYSKEQGEVRVCCIRIPVAASLPRSEKPEAKRFMSAYAVFAVNLKLNTL